MMRIVSIGLLLVSLAAAVPGGFQTADPARVFPGDGFDFTGSWDCAGAFRSGKAHRATFTGAVILGGKWIELTEQDVEPATGYQAKYLIGYDAQQKLLVEFDANNFGAASYTSADGWKDHVLTMTSSLSTDPKALYVANRFVYTIRAKDAFEVDWVISRTGKTDWLPSDHLACKRRG